MKLSAFFGLMFISFTTFAQAAQVLATPISILCQNQNGNRKLNVIINPSSPVKLSLFGAGFSHYNPVGDVPVEVQNGTVDQYDSGAKYSVVYEASSRNLTVVKLQLYSGIVGESSQYKYTYEFRDNLTTMTETVMDRDKSLIPKKWNFDSSTAFQCQ